MNVMSYKSYSARIEYSDEDGCFTGHLAGIRDVVGFHGESVAELRSAFEETRINDCRNIGLASTESWLCECLKYWGRPRMLLPGGSR